MGNDKKSALGTSLNKNELNQYNDDVISLTLFGSYGTKFWIEGKSDIDIMILMKYGDFSMEYEVEEYYMPILQKYFNYDDIHFTFISLKSFDSVFADIYIDFEDKIIFDRESHYDFLMYINKYNRVNENLITLVREDWESKYGIL